MTHEHAFLAPSSATDWEVCTAAPSLRAMCPEPPEEPGSPSAEGTAAHELAARFVDDFTHGRFAVDSREVVGQVAENGEMFTDEMYAGAIKYARDIQYIMQTEGVFTPHVEERTTPGGIHGQCWGTPDCWLWVPAKRRLYLWDYKFGYRQHEPTAPQFICYVADILNELGIDGLEDQKTTVVIRVVQPRGYHRLGPIREWRGYASELRGRINQLRTAAEEACSPNAKCVTGPQCEFCSARPCEALHAANLNRLRYIDEPRLPDIPDDVIGLELKMLRQVREEVDAHVTGLEARIESAIKDGRVIPGWARDYRPGRLDWIRPSCEVFGLGDLVGIELRKAEVPITPTQAIEAGVDKDTIGMYAKRKPGSYKLVEDTSSTRAKEAFENGN